MGCCGSKSDSKKTHRDHPVVSADNRQCRDVGFAVLFTLFWVGMFVVGAIGFSKGDPRRLTHGMDDRGVWCGEGENEKFPYLYFIPHVDEENGKNYVARECVPHCWTQEALDIEKAEDSSAIFQRRWSFDRTRKPTADNAWIREAGGDQKWLDLYWPKLHRPDVPGGPDHGYYMDGNAKAAYIPYASTDMFHFCIPEKLVSAFNVSVTDPQSTNNGTKDATVSQNRAAINTLLNSGAASVSRAFGDVAHAWWIILVCALIALVAGFTWTMLMKTFPKFFVWGTVVAAFSVSWIFAGVLYHQADVWKKNLTEDAPASEVKKAETLLYISYFFLAFSGVLSLLLLVLRKRIMITAEVIREASEAIGRMPFLVFYPIITFLFCAALFVWWIMVALFLASAGAIQDDASRPSSGYKDYHFDDGLQGAIVYHLFGLLWTTQFFLALGELVVAGAVANYYWLEDDKIEEQISETPVADSIHMAFRYYIGTLAFGSLIIAIIQFIRLCIEYLDKQFNKYKESQPWIKYVMCCLRCCFWCLEKCMKFINRNAYIMVAVYGDSFCASAKRAFELLIKNAARVAAVNLIGDFLLFLGKLFVTAVAGFVGFLILSHSSVVTSINFPLFIIVLIAWAIATGFMSVYEMSIDTILLCFCQDCEQTNGRPRYCSDGLKNILGHVDSKDREMERKSKSKSKSKRSSKADSDDDEKPDRKSSKSKSKSRKSK